MPVAVGPAHSRRRLGFRYDNFVPPAQVEELSLLYIEGLVLHSQLHPCLASTGGVGKVSITKVSRGEGLSAELGAWGGPGRVVPWLGPVKGGERGSIIVHTQRIDSVHVHTRLRTLSRIRL